MQKLVVTCAVMALTVTVVLQSRPSSADPTCMRQYADAARAKKISVDLFESEVFTEAPAPAPLRPLAAMMTKCLDGAYAEKKTVTLGRGMQAVIWHRQKAGLYDWCATAPDPVQMIGGKGPKRNWYSGMFSCKAGQKALPTCIPGVAC